ncbi:polysaccharide deacetylase [Gordoniibacillus kamchatkensis]|uniref:Polysaccharide deacetylase n=2 Tax=Gordoniibacillus kamchatkensis TaxID=1590651 RepID=A0ABR5AGJ0_9BACL|nr:polysaccharide deacetylase [Paenibacillus sp. VKM B-2647]
MGDLFYYLLVLLCIYTIIPTIFIRLFGPGANHMRSAAHSIALTFDDGPDPTYTPQLLDLLKLYDIKATFFVVGIHAQQHPELIRRMHREGHLIGVHNYIHHANAFMTPGKVRRQLDHAVNVVESIIGVKPCYYRPPWGIINLFDFWLFKRFRIILWSIIVGDWRSAGGKQKIKRRLMRKLRGGSVIVLHDSGQTLGANKDAPVYMLEALREFITETLAKGYTFVPSTICIRTG